MTSDSPYSWGEKSAAKDRRLLLLVSTLAVEFHGPYAIRLAGFLFRVIKTNVPSLLSHRALRSPPSGQLVPTHPLEPALVTRCQPSVRIVLSVGRFPQIGPAIVRRLAVDVIDCTPRPCTHHQEPRQPVSLVDRTINAHDDIAVVVERPSDLPRRAPSSLDLPDQQPALRVVVQQFLQPFQRNHRMRLTSFLSS